MIQAGETLKTTGRRDLTRRPSKVPVCYTCSVGNTREELRGVRAVAWVDRTGIMDTAQQVTQPKCCHRWVQDLHEGWAGEVGESSWL